GNLLFLGCQAFFDDVDKKLSNDFSLWYNKGEAPTQSAVFVSFRFLGNDLKQSPRLFEHFKDGTNEDYSQPASSLCQSFIAVDCLLFFTIVKNKCQ
ncbi:TPA: hypothetical protein ACGOSQ_001635, partial [Streptococcus suis]